MEEEMTTPSSDGISTTWLLIGTAVGMFIVHQLHRYTYFWRKGVPGPMPLPLAGNFIAFFSGFLPVIQKWQNNYGRTFGLYMGKVPTFCTTDIDLARMITTKEFSSFQASDDNSLDIKYLRDGLTMISGAPWKRVRSYVSPTFSGSKMRQVIPALNERCTIMMEILEKKQKNGEGFETKPVLMPFVLDCIACCCFGVEGNCQTDPDSPFVKNAKSIVDDMMKRPGFLLAVMFPALTPLWKFFGLEIFPEKPMDFFADIVRQVLELRKDGTTSERKDFIQLMIDAAEEGGEDESSAQNGGSVDEGHVAKKKIPLTIDEILGQSLLFFLAGYDTIATTTGYVLYSLAKHPEVQARLQEEIDDSIPEGKLMEYDTVFKMEYLDQVWQEALRMYPVAFILQRLCNKDFSYNGVDISAGDKVMINSWAIQHDAKYWPEPDTFDPERFTKEAKEGRHPCTYMPFGQGPRNCVGMRFAILESKMILISILRKYNIELLPETPDMTDLKNYGTASMYPTKGIHIRHVPRD